jgi:hypothetical protein
MIFIYLITLFLFDVPKLQNNHSSIPIRQNRNNAFSKYYNDNVKSVCV